MELALIVLCWTVAVSVGLASIMLISYLGAMTELAKAKAASERRMLH